MNALTLATAPHLITANSHPLEELERHILKHQDDIEIWFRQQLHEFPAPFYTSVDLRNHSNQNSIGDITKSAGVLNNILTTVREIREVN